MKYIVVAVFDRAAGAYARPAFVGSVGLAVRSFQDEVNRDDAQNELFKHPEDFDLFELGTYDDIEGRFDLLANPRKVAYAFELKFPVKGQLREAGHA